jgi:hypothetical protein
MKEMEKIKEAQKLIIEWCKKTGKKISLTPDSALEVCECVADLMEQAKEQQKERQCMGCEKELKPNEAIVLCKECTENEEENTVLEKYIKHVMNIEGTDFLGSHNRLGYGDVEFTEEEWKLLEDISEKVNK